MELPPSDELQRDVVLSYLDRERSVWLAARVLACTDPCGETREAVKHSMDRLDVMLEELIGAN